MVDEVIMTQQYNIMDALGRVIVVKIVSGEHLDVFCPLSRAGSHHHSGPIYQTTYYSDIPNISLVSRKIAVAPRQLETWVDPALGDSTLLIRNSFIAYLDDKYFCVSPRFVHSFTTLYPLTEMRSEKVGDDWYPYAVDMTGAYYLIYEGVIMKNIYGRSEDIQKFSGPYAYYSSIRSMEGFGKIIGYQPNTSPAELIIPVYTPRPYDVYHAMVARGKKEIGTPPALIALGLHGCRASVSLEQYCAISDKFGEREGFSPMTFGPFM